MPGDFIWVGSTQVWIQGYGTVQIVTKGGNAEQTIQLDNVALCPDILCNLVSFRPLRHQDIWWDDKEDLKMLRQRDNLIVSILTEVHNQWLIDTQRSHAALYVHTSSRIPRTVQKASATLWHKWLGHVESSATEHPVHQSEGARIGSMTTAECNACGGAKSRHQIWRTPWVKNDGSGRRMALDLHNYEEGSSTKDKKQMPVIDRYSMCTWDLYFKDRIVWLLGPFIQFFKKQYNISVKVFETDHDIATVKAEVGRWENKKAPSIWT